jgi:hypothetical protein
MKYVFYAGFAVLFAYCLMNYADFMAMKEFYIPGWGLAFITTKGTS